MSRCTGPRYSSDVPRGRQLCYSDAYARSTDTRVLAVELEPAPAVLLDSTTFYPGGGGQPADTGTITRSADGASWRVRSARRSDGEILHELDAGDVALSAPPAVGDAVEVGWPRDAGMVFAEQ